VGGVHRGKIVGVTQYGSEGDTFLRIALKSAGLRPDPGRHGFVEFPQKAAFLNLLQKTNVGDETSDPVGPGPRTGSEG
jgi:hypothetical protein